MDEISENEEGSMEVDKELEQELERGVPAMWFSKAKNRMFSI